MTRVRYTLDELSPNSPEYSAWEDGFHAGQVNERERCARHCDVLAYMLENGAGDYPPGSRLRQAAQNIRDGKPATLWADFKAVDPEAVPVIPAGYIEHCGYEECCGPDLRSLLTSLYNLPGVAEALAGAEDDFALAGEIADALNLARRPL